MRRLSATGRQDKNRVLHCSPGDQNLTRRQLTLRLSYDECQTWSAGKIIYNGPAAYSDLAVLADNTICCLFERDFYGSIMFTRFSLPWLTNGDDELIPPVLPSTFSVF
jgi:sialidase-1